MHLVESRHQPVPVHWAFLVTLRRWMEGFGRLHRGHTLYPRIHTMCGRIGSVLLHSFTDKRWCDASGVYLELYQWIDFTVYLSGQSFFLYWLRKFGPPPPILMAAHTSTCLYIRKGAGYIKREQLAALHPCIDRKLRGVHRSLPITRLEWSNPSSRIRASSLRDHSWDRARIRGAI
jgi:hypothetical protein